MNDDTTNGPGTPRLPRDTQHDVLVVIPTIATPKTLVPAFARLLQHLDGLRVHVVLAVNPKVPEDGDRSIRECVELWTAMRDQREAGCMLTVCNAGEPIGFGGAINMGLHVVLNTRSGLWVTIASDSGVQQVLTGPEGGPNRRAACQGIPPLTVVYNDDLVATRGWLDGMLRALESQVVYEWSELPRQDADGVYHRPARSMTDYGTPGLVGPTSNCAAGIQQIDASAAEAIKEVGWDVFARTWRSQQACTVLTATFLSGFCLGITADCMEAVAEFVIDMDTQVFSFSWLFDERYVVAGYEDNDLAVRADLAGYRAIVAADTFMGHIGHQSFDSAFPDHQRGMRNRLAYYDKWSGWVHGSGKKLVAAFRVRFDVPHDLGLFRSAIRRCASLVDGVAVLLTRNPAAMMDVPEYTQAVRDGDVPDSDLQLLRLCAAEPGKAHEYLAAWVAQVLLHAPDSRFPARCWGRATPHHLQVGSWAGDFCERTERNALLSMTETLAADWVLSVDHDELLEPRCTRKLLERYMTHPDPMVGQWDIAFINHWENLRMYRVDRPWGDGGTWTGGMRGFRMFRVNHTAPRRILAGGHNGLHCGNIPGADALAKRVAGVRFRHLGYVRHEDRYRKEKRYNVQDPTPDPLLVGGTSYAHITADEEMVLSPFVAEDGIGLHMLLHEGENADDLGRILDQLYGVTDRIVLVWTGAWADADKEWLCSHVDASGKVDNDADPVAGDGVPRRGRPDIHMRPTPAGVSRWPSTGPGEAMAKMAAHFGAEWLHHPLADNLGAARNAGLDALQGTPGMGWAVFFDPDEQLAAQAPVCLRRMADAAGCWAWMFRFINRYDDGGGNNSESIRMTRLDPDGRMRMYGRVHESFSRATRALVDEGFGGITRAAPFVTMNTGLTRAPAAMQTKLDFYRRLCELQLQEDPRDPGAWVTLGLYWANEGCSATAQECYARGVLAADREYLPFQEMGYHLMRQARNFMAEAHERMGGHSMAKPSAAIVDFLDKAAPPMKYLGTVGTRPSPSEAEAMATLPPGPAD